MDLSIILKFLSLFAMILVAFFWTSAHVDSRSRYNDEQTLLAGAVWTQILISVGLIVSAEVDDRLNTFVHGYFLMSGFTLTTVTGLVLMVIECKKWRRIRPPEDSTVEVNLAPRRSLDKTYLTIAILCLLSGILALIDFILLILLPEGDRRTWLRRVFTKRK